MRKRKYNFLFASAMFGGNTSLFESMREVLGPRDDCESTWLLMDPHPQELLARVPPISWNWTLKGGFSMRSRVRALEKQGKQFDAAFFNHLIPAMLLTGFRRRVPSIIAMDVTPLLMDLYGKWYNVPPTSKVNPMERMKYFLTRRAYADASYLMPFSTWVAGSLTSDYNMPVEKIRVMPAGINLSRWIPHERAPRSDVPTRVLFIGSDFIRKGGDLVLRLAAQEEFRSVEFHLLSYDGFCPLSDNVITHSNIKPNTEDLRRLYRESDIFILPSRGDLSPIAILEAMAMEMPVISTSVGGIAEVITEGKTGFIIPPNDETALAHRLKTLVCDRSLRLRFGKQARKDVEQHFNLANNLESIIDHLKKAADNAKVGQLNVLAAATHYAAATLDVSLIDVIGACCLLATGTCA